MRGGASFGDMKEPLSLTSGERRTLLIDFKVGSDFSGFLLFSQFLDISSFPNFLFTHIFP
jgi:hypothetical protein